MNWDHIRYFLAVAREGSVSRAAQSLGVNYTTVARRIDAFETALHTRLFDRLPNGHVMTSAAESVFDRALAMEQEAISLDRTIFGQDTRLSGRLRLATADIVAINMILPHIAQFQNEHPGIELEIVASDLPVDLALREADVAVRFVSGKLPEDAVGIRIADVSFGIYGSKTYLAARPDLNTPATTVLDWTPEPGRTRLPEPFRSDWILKHIPNAMIGPKFDSMPVMISAIRRGLGICGLPCFVGNAEPDLELAIDPQQSPSMSMWLLHHVDLRTTSRVRVFRDFLKEILLQQRGAL